MSEAAWARGWWRSPDPRAAWRGLDRPEQLAEALSWLLADDPGGPPPVGAPAVVTLDEAFAADRGARHDQLRRLWAAHDEGASYAAVPPRLWERLQERCGVRPGPATRAWVDEPVEGCLPQGRSLEECTEWWGHPAAPGAAYDDALWAWGLVAPDRGRGLAARSPRTVWRYEGGWQVAPGLRDVLSRHLEYPPRLEAGPGYLLACGVDAILELARGQPITARDRAVLWGTLVLPVIAPSAVGDEPPAARALDVPPDYLQTLPFHLLHPRIQVALAVLDRVATLLLSDRPHLAGVVERVRGRPVGAGEVEAATADLLRDLTDRALSRRAGAQWSSGFGFRMFRRLLRALEPSEPAAFARGLDRAVHGAPGEVEASEEAVGPLAFRLREALSTALSYPGRPRYPAGPAAEQLLDLVWLRWTDPGFLA